MSNPAPIDGVIAQRNPRAKYLRLRLDTRQRAVVLVIPRRASLEEAWRFAAANQGWIDDALARLPAPPAQHDGAEIALLGTIWQLQSDATTKRLQEGADNMLRLPDEPAADRQMRLRRWLKSRAKRDLPPLLQAPLARLNTLCPKAASRYARMRLSPAGTRWGSCSSRGTISLNWRLVLAPQEVAAYVAAHEVAHLAHMDHSPAFWHMCEALHGAPIKAARNWLKTNGTALMASWN